MTKRAEYPTTAHQIYLYDEDWAFLSTHYGPGGLNPEIGISQAIRLLLHKQVRQIRERQNARISETGR